MSSLDIAISAPSGYDIALPAARPDAADIRAARRSRRWVLVGLSASTDFAAVAGAYVAAGRANALLWLTAPVWIVAFMAYGLYDRRSLLSPFEEARRLFNGVAVSTMAVVMAIYALRLEVPRSWLARLCVSAVLFVAIARAAARKATHMLQAGGAVVERAVVIGTNEEARLIARTLLRQNWMGIRPVAFVATAGGSFDTVDGLPVAGAVDDVVEVVRRSGADRAILASTALPAGELARLTALLHGADVELQISAGLPQVAASRVTVEALDGLAMLNVRRNQLSHRQSIVKRAIDIVASSLLLALGAPLLAVLAVIVRATSTGPSLFRQTRVGEGGRTFTIFKFRTMVVDAEARKAELLAANEADGVLFKMQNDPRITRVGGTLRKLGLDELPQLINVLRGEMSLVGPRPPLPDETARYDEWVAGRLKVKPGITGLWQVNGRHELSFADYIRYDLFYVENWSVSLDLYVIARTLPALLARRGAA